MAQLSPACEYLFLNTNNHLHVSWLILHPLKKIECKKCVENHNKIRIMSNRWFLEIAEILTIVVAILPVPVALLHHGLLLCATGIILTPAHSVTASPGGSSWRAVMVFSLYLVTVRVGYTYYTIALYYGDLFYVIHFLSKVGELGIRKRAFSF